MYYQFIHMVNKKYSTYFMCTIFFGFSLVVAIGSHGQKSIAMVQIITFLSYILTFLVRLSVYSISVLLIFRNFLNFRMQHSTSSDGTVFFLCFLFPLSRIFFLVFYCNWKHSVVFIIYLTILIQLLSAVWETRVFFVFFSLFRLFTSYSFQVSR